MKVTCTFDRVGRSHDVKPLVFDSNDETLPELVVPENWGIGSSTIDWDEVCERIAAYIDPHIRSSDPEVSIGREADRLFGLITVGGFRNAGSFTVEVEGE